MKPIQEALCIYLWQSFRFACLMWKAVNCFVVSSSCCLLCQQNCPITELPASLHNVMFVCFTPDGVCLQKVNVKSNLTRTKMQQFIIIYFPRVLEQRRKNKTLETKDSTKLKKINFLNMWKSLFWLDRWTWLSLTSCLTFTHKRLAFWNCHAARFSTVGSTRS